MILSFLLGMCVMSVFAFIAICLIDDGKDWGVFLCGPASWVVFIFRSVEEFVRCWRKRREAKKILEESKKL